MKTAIVGILNNPATSCNSHSAGMVHIVSKLFDAKIVTHLEDWQEFDRLIIYHGVNFRTGSFNVIGGINNDVIIRCDKLQYYTKEVFSLDGFQLNDFSKKRKLLKYDDYRNIELIKLPTRDKIVIGDSHSISVWPDETYTILRNDGKTLFGYLKNPIDLSEYKHAILYFGNIDIRFHLARQSDPEKATRDLFNRYCEYASKYNATLTQLLPIECESRLIPKSGQYMNHNFFGSIEERKKLRLIANQIMFDSGLSIIEWPSYFLNEKGNLSFDIMEPKQSVHIKPIHYYRNNIKQIKLF